MRSWIFGESSGRPRLIIAVTALAVIMAAATGVEARVQLRTQDEPDVKTQPGRQAAEDPAAPVNPPDQDNRPIEDLTVGAVVIMNDFVPLKPDRPDQQPIFTVFNQWLGQAMANLKYDVLKLQNPFLPIQEIRGKLKNTEKDEPLQRKPPYCSGFSNSLKLVAITVTGRGSGALALFEDGAGNSYIFRKGDPIGCRYGHITKIGGSSVTIEEPPSTEGNPPRITELRLNVPNNPGGLNRLPADKTHLMP